MQPGVDVTAAARTEGEAGRTSCANCGARLQGRFCHVCGQSADDHKRSILHLGWEAIEGLFHLDGRLARTAPDLFFRPGRLARDYMEGRIARHVPPFRLFLAALVIFILAAEVAAHNYTLGQERQKEAKAAALATPAGRAAEAARIRKEAAESRADDLREEAADHAEDLKDKDEKPAKIEARHQRQLGKIEARYAEDLAHADRVARGLAEPPTPSIAQNWRKVAQRRASENPEYYWTVLFGWGHRLAWALLPAVGLMLAAVYRNKPQIFLYDHLVVAMQLMAFTFLISAPAFLLPSPWMFYWLAAAILWTPINLFQTLRGGYGSSLLGATIKTVIVWVANLVIFCVLIFALSMWSLAQLA